jgi:uncharacterized membrane protein SpoIIM required for sporulation
MKETQFVRQRQADWEAWDRWLGTTAKKPIPNAAPAADKDAAGPAEIRADALPSAFRRLCQDLSLARDRHYSSPLVYALHERVLAAHQRIYGARRRLAGHWLEFLVAGLPRLVRGEARFVLAAAALFFIPLLATLALLQWYPDGVYVLLSPQEVARFEEMYSPSAERLGRTRGASDDLMMLAFYIANNVRIDFQCFAGGMAFGLGSVFFLVYNGLMIGASAGYLTQLGMIETFWGFVAGHSAPELIGAVLSGAAGLKIGLALVSPGRLQRVEALKQAAQGAVRLLYGAAGLTFCAAFVEALWSPIRTLPFSVKIGAGVGVWILLLAYFLLGGRRVRAA